MKHLDSWPAGNSISDFSGLKLRSPGKTVIAEISGKDSLAAAIRYCETNVIETVIPTYSTTGTEYGDFRVIQENIGLLAEILEKRFAVEVSGLLELSNPPLWHILNGRFISAILKRYGFYSPCIGCHLYFHLTRLPLASGLNIPVIISGERTNHDKHIKLNQTEEVLAAFRKVFTKLGFELSMPIKDISSEMEVMNIIGIKTDWKDRQLACVLSGNYTDKQKRSLVEDPDKIQVFLENFILAAGISLGQKLISGEEPVEEDISSILEYS